jgi:hypothetical protein
VPQSLDRYVYTVNNPLRYVDPTGEDWWNPFAVLGAALNAVGQALSKINPLDLLDSVMMVVGFIPGLDIISDAYSMLRAVVDVAMGKGTWADVAMAAVFLLLPVGGSALKVLKKATNAGDSLGDVGKATTKSAKSADSAKGVAKVDGKGCHSPCSVPGPSKSQGPWKAGDSINAPTKNGDPSWTTVRNRYWKNDALNNPDSWSPANLERMKQGLAPLDGASRSYELHHILPRSQGGKHFPGNLEILTHDTHVARHHPRPY